MNTAACNSAVSTVMQTEVQELSSEACIKHTYRIFFVKISISKQIMFYK